MASAKIIALCADLIPICGVCVFDTEKLPTNAPVGAERMVTGKAIGIIQLAPIAL